MNLLEAGRVRAARPRGELGRLLVALDEGSLDFPLLRDGRAANAGKDYGK